jgi:hypothetical protein
VSAETFTFTKVVPCADADGFPIKEGSVLREISDGERGVVVAIVRPDTHDRPALSCVGDIGIQTRVGTLRVTNRYSKWRHIPHDEQTYEERFVSWLARPFHHDDESGRSRAEALAIDGIMALLPDDLVDWENGPWPDRIEDALKFLSKHLTTLATRP